MVHRTLGAHKIPPMCRKNSNHRGAPGTPLLFSLRVDEMMVCTKSSVRQQLCTPGSVLSSLGTILACVNKIHISPVHTIRTLCAQFTSSLCAQCTSSLCAQLTMSGLLTVENVSYSHKMRILNIQTVETSVRTGFRTQIGLFLDLLQGCPRSV